MCLDLISVSHSHRARHSVDVGKRTEDVTRFLPSAEKIYAKLHLKKASATSLSQWILKIRRGSAVYPKIFRRPIALRSSLQNLG